MLDFDNAIPANVEDNNYPHTQGGTDFTAMAINDWDRTEVSTIGFIITTLDPWAGIDYNPVASIIVTPYAMIPEPGTALLVGMGLVTALASRRRKHK